MEREKEEEDKEEKRELRKLELQMQESSRIRDFEMERIRLGVSLPRGGEGDERTGEGEMVRSLKMIPDFDEEMTEWFKIF